MYTFNITQTTPYALRLLSSEASGQIHSTYRKTINLSVSGKLLALQAAGSPLSSLSFITDINSEKMAGLLLEKGQTVYLLPDRIQLPSCEFVFSNAAVLDLSLKNCSLASPEQECMKTTIARILKNADTGGFDQLFSGSTITPDSLVLAAAKSKLDQCIQILKTGLNSFYQDAAKTLAGLLGLGLGLTPSGDDFLCGVLAGLILQKKDTHPFAAALRTEIASSLTNTNEISAAFLSCALQGEFSLAVKHLTQNPRPEEIAADFLAIGHSSGMDTLCGVYYGLSLPL